MLCQLWNISSYSLLIRVCYIYYHWGIVTVLNFLFLQSFSKYTTVMFNFYLWQCELPPGTHPYSIKIMHKKKTHTHTLASPTPHEKFGHTSLFSLPDILFNSGYLEHPPLDLPLQKHTSWKNQEACLTCVPVPWWHANTKDRHWFSVTRGRISPLRGLAACARPRGSL